MSGVSREELIDEAVRRVGRRYVPLRFLVVPDVLQLYAYQIQAEFRRVCRERGVAHA